jgi:hypothetical protein
MAVLIALSFGLLFLLIAMVVNIGFLVAAKINLQNAVDLAAYAGAAQQARYLSEIGKWNYEMRRNYKAMVFDYMIVLNGERRFDKNNTSNIDFKNYMTYPTDDTTPAHGAQPWACATLQRQGSTPPVGGPSLSHLCQNINPLDFQTALDASDQALIASGMAWSAACTGTFDPATCTSVSNSLTAQVTANTQITTTVNDTSNNLANYEDQPYNYNRRLIAWMLHDYRHLQTRIRGVHFGDISLGTYNNGNPLASTGRWALQKDPSPTIFQNSPISVAAKVLNGYTSTTGSPATGNILALTPDKLTNPIHNAAYATFRRNLIKVLSDDTDAKPKLYHLIPTQTTGNSQSMAGGCGGLCQEFTGPYVRLDNHDVDFWVNYLSIKMTGPNNYMNNLIMRYVTNFPVGVAKDIRVLTYYAVIGTVSTKNIPFNVFFGPGSGDNTPSQEATLVAVAAARPFGSRIGPYINTDCDNLFKSPNRGNCGNNGVDPLYPYSSPSGSMVPNFSLQDGTNPKLGVKLCVNKTEYAGSDPSHVMWGVTNAAAMQQDTHTWLYQTTTDMTSRWRVYTQPNNLNKDDGFPSRPSVSTNNPNGGSDGVYFDSDSAYPGGLPVHPLGTKDSVVAWHPLTTPPALDVGTKDNYETYLNKYYGGAIYQFGSIGNPSDRASSDGNPYKIYVFKYPEPMNGNQTKGWDYTFGGTTSIPSASNPLGMIERAFANAMAVNRFEVLRYIIPYRNLTNGTQNIPANVMNYITDTTKNLSAYIFGGLGPSTGFDTGRDVSPYGSDNVPFGGSDAGLANNVVLKEPGEVLGLNTPGDLFPETYSAWRFGSRGYRVKLVSIQDLINASNQTFQNPLQTSYTLPDQNVTVDLSKIKY